MNLLQSHAQQNCDLNVIQVTNLRTNLLSYNVNNVGLLLLKANFINSIGTKIIPMVLKFWGDL